MVDILEQSYIHIEHFVSNVSVIRMFSWYEQWCCLKRRFDKANSKTYRDHTESPFPIFRLEFVYGLMNVLS